MRNRRCAIASFLKSGIHARIRILEHNLLRSSVGLRRRYGQPPRSRRSSSGSPGNLMGLMGLGIPYYSTRHGITLNYAPGREHNLGDNPGREHNLGDNPGREHNLGSYSACNLNYAMSDLLIAHTIMGVGRFSLSQYG